MIRYSPPWVIKAKGITEITKGKNPTFATTSPTLVENQIEVAESASENTLECKDDTTDTRVVKTTGNGSIEAAVDDMIDNVVVEDSPLEDLVGEVSIDDNFESPVDFSFDEVSREVTSENSFEFLGINEQNDNVDSDISNDVIDNLLNRAIESSFQCEDIRVGNYDHNGKSVAVSATNQEALPGTHDTDVVSPVVAPQGFNSTEKLPISNLQCSSFNESTTMVPVMHASEESLVNTTGESSFVTANDISFVLSAEAFPSQSAGFHPHSADDDDFVELVPPLLTTPADESYEPTKVVSRESITQPPSIEQDDSLKTIIQYETSKIVGSSVEYIILNPLYQTIDNPQNPIRLDDTNKSCGTSIESSIDETFTNSLAPLMSERKLEHELVYFKMNWVTIVFGFVKEAYQALKSSLVFGGYSKSTSFGTTDHDYCVVKDKLGCVLISKGNSFSAQEAKFALSSFKRTYELFTDHSKNQFFGLCVDTGLSQMENDVFAVGLRCGRKEKLHSYEA